MKYQLFPLDSDVVREHFPEHYDDYDGAFFSALVATNNRGDILGLIATDGGEPEDQSFRRDWSWVPDELQKAYDAGYRKGFERGRPRDVLDMD